MAATGAVKENLRKSQDPKEWCSGVRYLKTLAYENGWHSTFLWVSGGFAVNGCRNC